MDTTNLFRLDGRIALVTGGSRGIGRMIAAGFIAQGATVYISSRKADACFEAATALGDKCIALPQDVSTVAGCEALAAQLAELRAGYVAALADPELLAEAETLGIPIDPADGTAVEGLVKAALAQSPETVEIVKAALTEQAPLVQVTSPILALADENKQVTINGKDGEIVVEPSGSRTQILINGAEAKRKELVVGMECQIEYDPAKEGNEPKKMDCKG